MHYLTDEEESKIDKLEGAVLAEIDTMLCGCGWDEFIATAELLEVNIPALNELKALLRSAGRI